MIVNPNNSAYYLATVQDVEQNVDIPVIQENKALLEQTLDWARTYLTRPHPQLGRGGAVCPYVRASLERNLFFMTVYPGKDLDENEVSQTIAFYKNWFNNLEPVMDDFAGLKSIIILFPDLSPENIDRVIEGVQDTLKPGYVQDGLMIGEFHAGPPAKAGLHNPDFKPLYSPIPLLAIRNMVATDYPFLKSDQDMFRAYLERFGGNVPNHLKSQVAETASQFGMEKLLCEGLRKQQQLMAGSAQAR